jgi:hypothetical protein
MRKLGIVGGVAATVLGATIVMAASPAPVATPAPVKTAAPVTIPAPAKTPAAAAAAPAAAANSWSAAVSPLTLQGTATFVKHTNGTATLSMKMQGLDPLADWTVTVMPGGTGRFSSRAILFRWTSKDVDRLGSGTLSVHLTAAQYRSIVAARNAHGFVALVSDGSRDAIATFPKA